MRLRDFIRKNHTEIDEHIRQTSNGVSPAPNVTHNDENLRLWILNDEPLYRWAQSDGVPI